MRRMYSKGQIEKIVEEHSGSLTPEKLLDVLHGSDSIVVDEDEAGTGVEVRLDQSAIVPTGIDYYNDLTLITLTQENLETYFDYNEEDDEFILKAEMSFKRFNFSNEILSTLPNAWYNVDCKKNNFIAFEITNETAEPPYIRISNYLIRHIDESIVTDEVYEPWEEGYFTINDYYIKILITNGIVYAKGI